MANKKLLIGLLAVMLVLGGCPESEEGVKDDGKDAPKTVKYESTDTAGKTYIFIITVSGSGVAEGDTYVITIKEAGQPDKIITGVVSEKGTDGTLTLKQNNSEQPLSVTVGNGQMTAINGPIAVEGGEPITAPGPLTPIVNNNNNNNNGGEEEINTGGNWLERKIIHYNVSNGVASVSGETNYNWITYRTSYLEQEQKYTTTSTSSSGTTSYQTAHMIIKGTSDTNYEQKYTTTSTSSSGTASQTSHYIRNGQTVTQTQTSESTYSNGQFRNQTVTYTIEYDTATVLILREVVTQTINTNQAVPPDYPLTYDQTVNWTIELLSDTGGIKTYKYHNTSKDAGEYEEYKYQNGKKIEEKEYEDGELRRTTTYGNNGKMLEEVTYEKTQGNYVGRYYYTYYTYNDNNTIRERYVQYDGNTSKSLESTETSTSVTIKEGIKFTMTNTIYSGNSQNNRSETVTVLSETDSEVVVREQKFYGNALTAQTDRYYRK